MFIPDRELVDLLIELPYPLGIHRHPEVKNDSFVKRKKAIQMTREMHVEIVGGVEPKVQFHQVLQELTRLAMP